MELNNKQEEITQKQEGNALNMNDAYETNLTLRSIFKKMDLDVSEVWQSTTTDLDIENDQLANLLHWVETYKEYPDRKKLKGAGMLRPPIVPAVDENTDWRIFERWVKGIKIRYNQQRLRNDTLTIPDSAKIEDRAVDSALDSLKRNLAELNIEVKSLPKTPPRLVYEFIEEELGRTVNRTPFQTPRTLELCKGYCPACIQRPWCKSKGLEVYPEDEAGGTKIIPEQTRRYLKK